MSARFDLRNKRYVVCVSVCGGICLSSAYHCWYILVGSNLYCDSVVFSSDAPFAACYSDAFAHSHLASFYSHKHVASPGPCAHMPHYAKFDARNFHLICPNPRNGWLAGSTTTSVANTRVQLWRVYFAPHQARGRGMFYAVQCSRGREKCTDMHLISVIIIN